MSVPSRPFENAKKWTYLLFEEYFAQGDLELEHGMPVSFLCDRDTTTIPMTQPIYVREVVTPLFVALSNVFPQYEPLVTNCQ